ncbi:hypothetical protein [Salmonirosea aquatica]|uniref:Uncharacterized protein n=1 Tax=Salmonirosea aquatica TaxID=2654236 RepID=A0A7C9BV04_9BACT|nr:hypothetical protein [Cytophagaceae bacterium SJW1-29]MPR36622.1 hypothetical protein [Cytophagaceae bacterium SJW1-29]MPR36941.1 hypothetical protein [Cytophagaceae bacterium SJW1-29]
MGLTTGTKPEQVPNWGQIWRRLLDYARLRMLFLPQFTIDELRNTRYLLAKAVLVTDSGKVGIFYRDDADATSADDGQNSILTADDTPVRFKRRLILRRYTPVAGTDTTMELGATCYDDNYFYIKTGASTIKKIALTAL